MVAKAYANARPNRPNRRFRRVLVAASALTLGFLLFTMFSNVWRDFGYLTRPIWDEPPKPFDPVITHYPRTEGLSPERWCSLHGWRARPHALSASAAARERDGPGVYDAIIFSVELDLLEIRMRELWPHVDKFVILESDRTFTGRPKNTTFWDNRARYEWAKDKIHYQFIPGRELDSGESPFVQEAELRAAMNAAIGEAGAVRDDLIIMSDIDEIPRRGTIDLLSTCQGWGDVIHLQLRNYLYSFEFHVDDDSWRASVRRYVPGRTGYGHSRVTDTLLADAGWHCSFCFRYLDEFKFKMQAYSHADRVTKADLLDHARIQRVICDGDDIYDMWPEAYTWLELARRLGSMPRETSMLDIPVHLAANPDKYAYLLPGGCEREAR